jgi:hypothetical protein
MITGERLFSSLRGSVKGYSYLFATHRLDATLLPSPRGLGSHPLFTEAAAMDVDGCLLNRVQDALHRRDA